MMDLKTLVEAPVTGIVGISECVPKRRYASVFHAMGEHFFLNHIKWLM